MEIPKAIKIFEPWLTSVGTRMPDMFRMNGIGTDLEFKRAAICYFLNQNNSQVFTANVMQSYFPCCSSGRVEYYLTQLIPSFLEISGSRMATKVTKNREKIWESLCEFEKKNDLGRKIKSGEWVNEPIFNTSAVVSRPKLVVQTKRQFKGSTPEERNIGPGYEF